MVHHCALYSVKADIQNIMVVVKKYFVSFLLYIDLVFCFFAPEKQYSGILVLKGGRCLFMEEGSFLFPVE